MLHVNKTYFWFVLFLISHGAMLKFRRNWRPFKFGQKSLCEYVANTPASSLILRAFMWDATTEGVGYWYKLSGKWQSICERFNIK